MNRTQQNDSSQKEKKIFSIVLQMQLFWYTLRDINAW